MENLDEKKVNDENNRMTEWTDISETVEAVECNEVDEANERGGKKEAKKGGFWKGFVTGAAASMCGVILFCGSWLIGQQKSLKEAATKEEIGAAVLTDDATLRKLSQVQELIEDYYLNEVDEELLSDYLFKGVAVGLDDPYAAYYSSEEGTSKADVCNLLGITYSGLNNYLYDVYKVVNFCMENFKGYDFKSLSERLNSEEYFKVFISELISCDSRKAFMLYLGSLRRNNIITFEDLLSKDVDELLKLRGIKQL